VGKGCNFAAGKFLKININCPARGIKERKV